MKRALLVLAFLTTFGSATRVRAEGFDLGIFRPADSTTGYFSQQSAAVLPHLVPNGALTLEWGHNLLLARGAISGEILPNGKVVRDRITGHLTAAFGLFDRVELGIRVPAVVWQDGTLVQVPLGTARDLAASVFGDVTAALKLRVFGHRGIGLAAGVDASFPSGNPDAFSGSGSVSAQPYVVLGWDDRDYSAALDVGYRIRKADSAGNIEVDDELTAGAALAANVVRDRTWAILEIYVLRGVSAHDSVRETPAEGIMGARFRMPMSLYGQLGMGAGITRGYGTPQIRTIATLGYAPNLAPPPPPPSPDRDGDRIPNDRDKCPDDPEDYDRFEDADGCPDPDNDKDTVLDGEDRCPNDPGPPENQGCPDIDSDEDGIPNRLDQCPDQREDKDGFQDDDGCPDEDNDKDGVLDVVDKCPDDPEDKDGFEDLDGCPDPDNDKDGFLDNVDKCPNEAEIFNGVDDDDGCPDKGKELAKLEGDKVEIREQVHFDVDKATIRKSSDPLLAAVAKILILHTEIKKIRVEGHTDSTGTHDHNMKLSQDRADSVKQHLVDKNGIDAARLEAVGYGPDQPIDSNKTARGKAKNRRVEFVVIEK